LLFSGRRRYYVAIMGEMLFAVVAGLSFVILGRWMYTNPTKVYPTWVSSKPDSRLLQQCVRAFGTAIIFGGAYAVAAGIVHWLHPVELSAPA
jgi:hypothetical protein